MESHTIYISQPLTELIAKASSEEDLESIRDRIPVERDEISTSYLPQKRQDLHVAEQQQAAASARQQDTTTTLANCFDALEGTRDISGAWGWIWLALFLAFVASDFAINSILPQLYDVELPVLSVALITSCSLIPSALELILGATWAIDLTKPLESFRSRMFLGCVGLLNFATIGTVAIVRGTAIIAAANPDGVDFGSGEKMLIELNSVLLALSVAADAALFLSAAQSCFRIKAARARAIEQFEKAKAEDQASKARALELGTIATRIQHDAETPQADVDRIADAHAAKLHIQIDTRLSELAIAKAEKERSEAARIAALDPLERLKYEATQKGILVPSLVN